MKTFFSTLLLSSLLLAGSAAAVEVGDIYYSDKTFSSSVQSGKKAIGVVYWVSTNKDFGYIVALEEGIAWNIIPKAPWPAIGNSLSVLNWFVWANTKSMEL